MKSAASFSIGIVLLLAGPLSAAEPPALPLKISINRRHLADQKDQPFLIHGDAPWSIITGVSKQEADRYLEDRRKKGFNSIIVNLIEHKYNGPVNREGEGPFTIPGDFATPNEKYFAHADWVLRKAAEKDIVVFLFPMYLGSSGGDGDAGWYQEALLNGFAKCRQYGRYVGRRYKDFANIVWVMGGDRNVGSAREATEAMAGGIRGADPNHLFTAHAAPEFSTMDEYGFAGLDVNATYTYGVVHRMLLRDYNRKPVMPFFLSESTYEGEHNASPIQIRRQAYWAMLCGAAGQFIGNRPIWGFYPGWESALDSEGSRGMVHLRVLFLSRPWQDLIPDQTHQVLVDGVGEFRGLDYAGAARTADKRTLIVYMPTPRTVTVDMAEIAGSRARAWWFDPRGGGVKEEGEGATSGRRRFAPPGDGDWVLVVEDASLANKRPNGRE